MVSIAAKSKFLMIPQELLSQAVVLSLKAHTSLQGGLPDSETFRYQFRETSSGSHPSVVEKVKKSEFEEHYNGTSILQESLCCSLEAPCTIQLKSAKQRNLSGKSLRMLKRGLSGQTHCMEN